MEYNQKFSVGDDILEYIILETIVAYKPYPVQTISVNNYISEFLKINQQEELISKYELHPFQMLVQLLSRTFVDKLYALCDYHLENKYNRYSRHLYDIHKIWKSKEFDLQEVKKIMDDVTKDRHKYGDRNLSAQAGKKPNEILKEIIRESSYKNDYIIITSKLIQDRISYDDCIKGLNQIFDSNIMLEIVISY